MNKNIRQNVSILTNPYVGSDTVRTLHAAEILYAEFGISAADICCCSPDKEYVRFVTFSGDTYNIITDIEEEAVYVFVNSEFKKGYPKNVDEVNRISNKFTPIRMRDRVYIQMDVYDIKDTESFDKAMPWEHGVIYTLESGTGKYGGRIHLPVGGTSDNSYILNEVFDALKVCGANLENCMFRTIYNDKVSEYKLKNMLFILW